MLVYCMKWRAFWCQFILLKPKDSRRPVTLGGLLGDGSHVLIRLVPGIIIRINWIVFLLPESYSGHLGWAWLSYSYGTHCGLTWFIMPWGSESQVSDAAAILHGCDSMLQLLSDLEQLCWTLGPAWRRSFLPWYFLHFMQTESGQHWQDGARTLQKSSIIKSDSDSTCNSILH